MEPISAAAREMMITPISERVIPASLFPAPTGVRFPLLCLEMGKKRVDLTIGHDHLTDARL